MSDALQLELQAVGVVNSSMGAESQSESSRRPVSALNHGANVSPTKINFLMAYYQGMFDLDTYFM